MRKFHIALVVMLNLPTATALAQNQRPVGAFHCANISNDIARLECYDKAYTDYREAAETPGNWKIQTETNPLDDTLTTLIALSAESGAEPPYGQRYRLVIRCQSRQLDAWVDWRTYVGKAAPQVTWRIGDASAKTKRWDSSTNGSGTFYPGNTDLFVRGLLGADRLVVQISPKIGQKKMAIFNIKGLDQAVKPFESRCLPKREKIDLLLMETFPGEKM